MGYKRDTHFFFTSHLRTKPGTQLLGSMIERSARLRISRSSELHERIELSKKEGSVKRESLNGPPSRTERVSATNCMKRILSETPLVVLRAQVFNFGRFVATRSFIRGGVCQRDGCRLGKVSAANPKADRNGLLPWRVLHLDNDDYFFLVRVVLRRMS